jgi:Flp pilus assembly protein TadG
MALLTRVRTSRFRVSAIGERGAELIEFAFVLPVLLFVAFGIIDFGFLFKEYEVVTNAAREGARLKSLGDSTGYSTADVQSRVQSYIINGGLDGSLVNTAVNTANIPVNSGGTVNASGSTVQVTYPHRFWVLAGIAQKLGGGFGTATLTASSTMRSEVQAAP